eukprot:gene5474-7579_t
MNYSSNPLRQGSVDSIGDQKIRHNNKRPNVAEILAPVETNVLRQKFLPRTNQVKKALQTNTSRNSLFERVSIGGRSSFCSRKSLGTAIQSRKKIKMMKFRKYDVRTRDSEMKRNNKAHKLDKVTAKSLASIYKKPVTLPTQFSMEGWVMRKIDSTENKYVPMYAYIVDCFLCLSRQKQGKADFIADLRNCTSVNAVSKLKGVLCLVELHFEPNKKKANQENSFLPKISFCSDDDSTRIKWLDSINNVIKLVKLGGTLLIAASTGDINALSEMMKDSRILSKTLSEIRYESLISAILGQHIEVVKLLCQHDAEVNRHDQNGNTPLILATNLGNFDMVKLLLQEGATVNKSNRTNTIVPLHLAIDKQNYQIVELLIIARADANRVMYPTGTNLISVVTMSATNNNDDVLKANVFKSMFDFIKASPSNPILTTNDSLIQWAFLIKDWKSPQGDQRGFFPLFIAASHGNKEIVKLLIKAGADLNKVCCGGKTAIDIAVQKEFRAVEHICRSQLAEEAVILPDNAFTFDMVYVSERESGCI